MRVALTFEPYWVAFRGGAGAEGRGLLGMDHSTVEKFVVILDDFKITVLPKKGEIWLDSRCDHKGLPGDLVWLRRMRMHLSTRDANHSPPECVYYFVGIRPRQRATGYQLFEDGRIVKGTN